MPGAQPQQPRPPSAAAAAGAGFHPPPPYRSPPNPGGVGSPQDQQQHQQQPPPQPFSKFNVSEPNMLGGPFAAGSPSAAGATPTYRHTLNQESSQHMQHGLKNLMHGPGVGGGPHSHAHPKHQTLDSTGQSIALQQLRSNGAFFQQQQQHQGLQHQQQQQQRRMQHGGDTYVSPDNLRDAANRMFARNHQDRASFDNAVGARHFMGSGGVGPQQYQQHHQNLQQQQQQHNHLQNGGSHQDQPFYSNQQAVLQQQQDGGSKGRLAGGGTGQRIPNHQQHYPQHQEDPRRNSYANQSFRKATGQEQQQKHPPQVPPKPNSRSASREKLRESIDKEVDHLDQELKHILTSGSQGGGGQRMSMGGGGGGSTPPLPALSPDPTTPESPAANNHLTNDGLQVHGGGSKKAAGFQANRPDLLEHRRDGIKAQQQQQLRTSLKRYQDEMATASLQGGPAAAAAAAAPGAATLTADLESVLGGLQTDLTSGEDDGDSAAVDATDAAAIRRQLDGLEGMYSEVLKLLGLRRYGRVPQQQGGAGGGGLDRGRRKMYGSMSSLPSVSSIGSRHIYSRDGGKRSGGGAGKRPGSAGGRDRGYNKRFQRLESHVVTLARSVAHLSSELRSQQALTQEVETLRAELQQIKGLAVGQMGGAGFLSSPALNGGGTTGRKYAQQSAQAHRVKKLTKFFGDEPPLLRLFLKDLGYEKYASAFEEARIGLLELPCLSEERLERLGVPMGPRMRILQEARAGLMPPPTAAAVAAVAMGKTATGTGAGGAAAGMQQPAASPRDPNNYNVYIL